MEDADLGDRFDVRRRVGQGGMGVVYEALDRKLGAVVALKTLIGLEPSAIYRFKQEFRALADVSHPNLVALHELFADEAHIFFTMELVLGVDFLAHVRPGAGVGDAGEEGALDATVMPDQAPAGPSVPRVLVRADTPLSQRTRAGKLDAGRLRPAIRQLAEGVFALHAAGKLHRDLKPSNVLVTPEGRVVILDFGLVSDRVRGGLGATAEGTVMGTPAYMAPEQAGGRRARPASDWYAFGAILYEALTGALPFGGTPLRIALQKQVEDPPPPRALAPGAPEDLDALCVALLRRDPDARPGGEEVVRRLGGRGAATGAAALPTQGARFIGRAGEMRDLEAALQQAIVGHATLALVHGRSGMGKSALLARFADELGSDVVVLSGRCYERESVPYKAFDSLVDGLTEHLRRLPEDEVRALLPRDAGALARLFPVLRRVAAMPGPDDEGSPGERERLTRAYAALRELFGGIARRAPLVLTLDDLQWGDADSARLLEAILAPPSPPPLLVVGAYRSEEADKNPLLREIAGLAAVSIQLSPLSAAETEALARALLPAAHPEAARRARAITREAAGIPFFIGELCRVSGDAAAAPVSLDRLVAARIERLPAEARRLLEAIAVAGRPTPQGVVLEAAGSPDARAALRTLRADGLVRTEGMRDTDVVEAYHDRIREGAVAALDPAALRDHHRRLAAALEAAGADAEVLAEHHLGAGDLPRAATFALAAADEAAAALAFHRAAKLYVQRIAIDEARPAQDPAAIDALRVKLGDALTQCGRGAEAARPYLDTASRASPEVARELRRRAAEGLLISGHIDEGLAVLDVVLGEVGMRLPASTGRALVSFLARAAQLRLRGVAFRERAEADVARADLARVDACFTATVGLTFVDPVRAADFQARHVLLALRAGEPSRVTLGLSNYAAHLATEGGSTRPRVDALLAAAASIAARIDHPQAIARARLVAGSSAFFQGRFREAIGDLDAAERLLRGRCTGVAWELDSVELWARLSLVYLGRLRDLGRRAVPQLADATARGDQFSETWIRAGALPFARLAADDPRGARASIARALAPWKPGSFLVLHYLALWTEVLTDLYEGDAAGALARLAERWPAVDRSLLLRIQICRVNLLHLRAVASVAAAGSDPRSPHLAAAERDARAVAAERMPYAGAMAAAVRAGIAAARADRPAAAALLRAALARFDDLDMALSAASARRRLAALTGDAAEARSLREASRAYFAAQHIQRPDRLALLHSPGPDDGAREPPHP